MQTQKNISWINWVRAICMFLVYFFHTENRAKFDFLNRDVDLFIKAFFVNAFFVVSGYLLYRKQEQIYQRVKDVHVWLKEFGLKYLSNILFILVIPSIIFSLFLFVPKLWFRHQNFDSLRMLGNTIGGSSLWFVAALAVAQLLIFILLYFRKLSLLLWGGYGVGCMLIAVLLHKSGFENFPWCYQSGMCAVFLLWFGSLLYKNEKIFSLPKTFFIILFVGYLLLVLFTKPLTDLGHVNINLQGILLCLISTVILIRFCMWLKPNKFVEKIGRSTIGLYFLSGAVPETIAMIVKRFVEFNNMVFLFVVVISFIVSVVLNEFLRKYIGFIFDLRILFPSTKQLN